MEYDIIADKINEAKISLLQFRSKLFENSLLSYDKFWCTSEQLAQYVYEIPKHMFRLRVSILSL